VSRNLYCDSAYLSNEASVESFFVLRMLTDLGYSDSEIQTKQSIKALTVSKGGRHRELFKPDYVLVCNNLPAWLIDAKSPDEKIEDFTYQCASYALQINRKFAQRPLRYYMLTNGLLTRVYVWDQEQAVLSLRFGDFNKKNTKYRALLKLLAAKTVRQGWITEKPRSSEQHLLRRPPMDAVKKAFLRCHRIIWKSEKMSPQAAFVEFAKLLFVKLWEDRRLRDQPQLLNLITRGEPLPASDVRFSSRWVEQQQANDPSPVDSLLFRRLVQNLEADILGRRRKRIFEANEHLHLSPGTAKHVVKELEHFYLFGIDEDLNGRMFEAFLAATMRGQALGQYFTPRSIVKLMTRLADLKAGRGEHGIERVLDACCGTGGFLIEALTEMRRQIWDNRSLTEKERQALLEEIANEAIFGIDAGRDPAIARIARINMYLHGDGGSRVYMTDALRQPPDASEADPIEVKEEVAELRKVLASGMTFDAVLTNPPFSMDYSMAQSEERVVLEAFELASYQGKRRRSLRSSVMFIERYWQLLRPGGRLLTVIDDSVLSNKNFAAVRDFIRERFLIRAVISLHGDAFQRSGARAKTSVMYLVKRDPSDAESQPAAFVFESRYVGLDDVVPRTRQSVAEAARSRAVEEIEEIVAAFRAYLRGKKGDWLVPPDQLGGRLDAKFLRPWSVTELTPTWESAGADVEVLENLVDAIEEPVQLQADTEYTFLRISYEGVAERGERALGKEISYTQIGRPRVGDIVVSNISAVYRAICVIPDGMDDLLVSNEFTVLRLKSGVDADPMYLWSILRSPAIIAEWMSAASGVGRHRVDWSTLRTQRVPLLRPDQMKKVGHLYRAAEERQREAHQLRQMALAELAPLDLAAEKARDRLERAKPPR